MIDFPLNQLVQGVLQGGLYALLALGLSLSLGILKFVNIAHGDMIVLMSFGLLSLGAGFGLHPALALLLFLPVAFAMGLGVQRLLLQRVLGRSHLLSVLLVTFGLSVVIQNGLLEGFGPDTRKIAGGAIEMATIRLPLGVNVGLLPLVTFAVAVVMIAALDLLLYRTTVGAQIRAVSDDAAAAELVGLRPNRIYGIAMGIVGVTIAVSACLLAIRTNFEPTSGTRQLLIAFEVVVIGGLGSLWGTLIGGILLGVAQAVGAHFDASLEMLAGHLLFLAVLVLRPNGLIAR